MQVGWFVKMTWIALEMAVGFAPFVVVVVAVVGTVALESRNLMVLGP
jgi:hypothetical protein